MGVLVLLALIASALVGVVAWMRGLWRAVTGRVVTGTQVSDKTAAVTLIRPTIY